MQTRLIIAFGSQKVVHLKTINSKAVQHSLKSIHIFIIISDV